MKLTDKSTNTPKPVKVEDVVAAVRDCLATTFGVVGIANITNKKGKKEEGIVVRIKDDGTFSVDSYVIVSYGVKITETLRSAQTSILYKLNKKFQKRCKAVTVIAESVSSNK